MNNCAMTTTSNPETSSIKGRMLILIVDDDVKIQRLLRTCLKLSDYEVVTTTKGKEALDLVTSDKPSLVILDMLMPGMDGFDVLRQLRSFSDLPVIAMSANANVSQAAFKLGANDFLAKPFLPNELIGRIRSILYNETKMPVFNAGYFN
jgi:two-component system KDP operon response regulator KdpE